MASILIGVAASASAGPVSPTFLHARGQDIVNENGDKVMLRGVGLGNWMLPEGYMWKFGDQGDRPRRIEKVVSDLIGPEKADHFWTEFRKNYITEADVQRIAELGYNSVRPALNARLFLTEGDSPKPVKEGYELLDNLVKWCKARGVYVIIDMHAAPGGQTGQNIDDSADDKPGLFMETKYQDRLVELWTTIAKRYKNEPAVAGYDLLNEPLPHRTGAAAKFKDQLEPLYKRITKAIREVDPKHMVILEGADWSNDWSVFSMPFDKNLVYQFHYYCWDTPSKLKTIGNYLDLRKRFNAPVWVGETGERDPTIYWATTEYFEANNIGWAFWPWKKLDSSNAPYSVKPPAQWEAIAAYTRGGDKPSVEVAQKAFDEFLVNIRVANCVGFPAVVNSMLRRVPSRIEGENYGQEGLNISYSVKEAGDRSQFYRQNEPVPVKTPEPGHRYSDQFITLKAMEWTAYTIDSAARKNCAITLKARAEDGPAEAQLVVGDRILNVKVPQNTWTEINLGAVSMDRGTTRLKWIIKEGTVDLDWLNVTEDGQQPVTLGGVSKPNGG